MVSEWRTATLGELAEIYDGPHATPPKTDEGPVFLGISNLASGRIRLVDSVHVSEADYARWTRRVEPKEGDVVFSYETRLGEAAIIPRGLRCCLGRRMGLLRARPEKVDQRFLLYAYLGPQFQETLRSRTVNGSTVDRIPLIEMPSFPITIPEEIDEQRAIAHILGTLDDKIELNRRMAATLEEMARTIFKSWFIDFDPVRAKAEDRPTNLPPEIDALFPDTFEDSNLGRLPKAWAPGTLADMATLNPESWNSRTRPAQIRYVDLANTKWGKIESITVYRKSDAPSRAQRVLRTGDTIVGTVRPGNGSFAQVSEPGLTGSTGFAVLRPRPNTRAFVYIAATSSDRIDELAHLADGGAYPAIRPEVVLALQVALPGQALLTEFEKTVGALLDRAAKTRMESNTLSALRDALLPKLISGEIQILDVERAIQEATV